MTQIGFVGGWLESCAHRGSEKRPGGVFLMKWTLRSRLIGKIEGSGRVGVLSGFCVGVPMPWW